LRQSTTYLPGKAVPILVTENSFDQYQDAVCKAIPRIFRSQLWTIWIRLLY